MMQDAVCVDDRQESNQQDGGSVFAGGPASHRRKLKWSQAEVWDEVPPIKNHSSTLDGNRLYIFGGYDGKRNHNDLFVLDIETYSWSRPQVTGQVPVGRNGHTAALAGRRIFVLGGWLGSGPLAASDMHTLNLDTMSWSEPSCRGEQPGSCNMHTCDCVQDKLFVFRGGDGRDYLSDLHVLDLPTMTWKAGDTQGQSPPPRGNHASAVEPVQGQLFIFGGWDGRRRLNDLHVLDTIQMIWSKPELTSGMPPQPRAGMSLTHIRGVLYLFGGSGHATKCFKDLHIYDPATRSWTAPPISESDAIPECRAGHVAAAMDRKLLVFGGSCGATYFRDCHLLDTDPPPSAEKDVLSSAREVLRRNLAEYRNNPTFSDVTFLVGEDSRPFYAHKVVVSLLSQKFRAMLSGGMRESTQPEIRVPEVSWEIFSCVMDFLYTANLDLPPGRECDVGFLVELLRTADEYMLDDVKEVCADKLCDIVTEENVADLLREAETRQVGQLQTFCEWFQRQEAIERGNSERERCGDAPGAYSSSSFQSP